MDWQQLVALAIVGATAGVAVGSRIWRRKFAFKRETGCGCCSAGHEAPQHSVVFHARKGERPKVIVKMK